MNKKFLSLEQLIKHTGQTSQGPMSFSIGGVLFNGLPTKDGFKPASLKVDAKFVTEAVEEKIRYLLSNGGMTTECEIKVNMTTEVHDEYAETTGANVLLNYREQK